MPIGNSNNPSVQDVAVIRSGRSIIFTVPYKITEEQAETLQLESGYHPNGYGFYKFRLKDNHSSWECRTSCD